MKRFSLIALMGFICFPLPVLAGSKYVSSPSVKDGVTTLKNRGSVEWGDENNDLWRNKVTLEHGVNLHFKVGIAAEIRKYENDSLEYTASEIKALYKLSDESSSLQSAIEGAYKFNHAGDSDQLQAKLLLAGSAYGLDHKANLIVSHDVGDDDDGEDWGAGFAWGSYYDMGTYALGGEYYADFGDLEANDEFDDQEHHIGPVVAFDLPINQQRVINTKLGYLVGLSDASRDHVIKYEMGTDF